MSVLMQQAGPIFAWGGVVLSVGAAAGYGYTHDWRRCLYYTGAAFITAVINWP
jgi:hypothetical protein